MACPRRKAWRLLDLVGRSHGLGRVPRPYWRVGVDMAVAGFKTARGAYYRRYRAGRRLSRRISARPRLYRPRRQAALVVVQHRAHRPSLSGSARRQCAVPAALWRHDRFRPT